MKISGSMRAIFSTKRAIFNLPTALTKDITKLCGVSTFSTAYERAEGRNAVAESRSSTNEGLHDAKQEGLDVDEDRGSGATGFMAEKARDGAEKAKEMAENVRDTAKETMDGAWEATQKTTEQIKQAAVGDDKEGPNDDVNWKKDHVDNVEDLRKRDGGYDKGGVVF